MLGTVCKLKIYIAPAPRVRASATGKHSPGDRKGKKQSGVYAKGSRSNTSWQLLRGHAPDAYKVQEGDSYQAMEESASQTHVLKISEMHLS